SPFQDNVHVSSRSGFISATREGGQDSRPDAGDRQLYSIYPFSRGEVERLCLFPRAQRRRTASLCMLPPGTVGRYLRSLNLSQVFSLRRKDPDASRSRTVQVPLLVRF